MNVKNSILGLAALVTGACATPRSVEKDVPEWMQGVKIDGDQYISVACVKGKNISLLYPVAEGRARTALARAFEGKNDVDVSISHEPAEYEIVNGSLCARIIGYKIKLDKEL